MLAAVRTALAAGVRLTAGQASPDYAARILLAHGLRMQDKLARAVLAHLVRSGQLVTLREPGGRSALRIAADLASAPGPDRAAT